MLETHEYIRLLRKILKEAGSGIEGGEERREGDGNRERRFIRF